MDRRMPTQIGADIRLQKLEAIGGLDALAVLAYGKSIAELPKDITAAEIRTGAWQLIADALEAETIARRPLPGA